jgi:hypothetical protein
MVIDRVDRWTERALAFLSSPEGQALYLRNKYERCLDRKNNICGIIQKAAGVIKYEPLLAIYERIESNLAARKNAKEL